MSCFSVGDVAKVLGRHGKDAIPSNDVTRALRQAATVAGGMSLREGKVREERLCRGGESRSACRTVDRDER